MCFQWKTRRGPNIFTLSANFFASPRDHLGPLFLLEDSEVILGQEVLDDAVEASGSQARVSRNGERRGSSITTLQRRGWCFSSLHKTRLCRQSWNWNHWVVVRSAVKGGRLIGSILLWLSSWSFWKHFLKDRTHWLSLPWVSIKLTPKVCCFDLQW